MARLPARPRRARRTEVFEPRPLRPLYLRDPDGHILELATRSDRRRARRAAAACGSDERGDGGGAATSRWPRRSSPSCAATTWRWRSVSEPIVFVSDSDAWARNRRQRVLPQRRWLIRRSASVMLSACHGDSRIDVGRRELTIRDATLELRPSEADLVGPLQRPQVLRLQRRSSLTRSCFLPAARHSVPDRHRRVRVASDGARTGQGSPSGGSYLRSPLGREPAPLPPCPDSPSPCALRTHRQGTTRAATVSTAGNLEHALRAHFFGAIPRHGSKNQCAAGG